MLLTERGPQSSEVGTGALENCGRQAELWLCAAGHGSRTTGDGTLNRLPGGVCCDALKKDGNSCLKNNGESGRQEMFKHER